MRWYVINKVITALAVYLADKPSEGTHEGYPTYVAIKVAGS
jgi:hypothetical protein